MLLSLTLTDFILVHDLSLDFHPGFSVLTGETGAGKSILLDALALVLGERADSSVVRNGAQRADISAEFALETLPELAAWLAEQDLAGDDGQLLLRRVVEVGGRSRAFINGRPATAQQLKAVGGFLVDIHGQHAHYSLLKATEQRRLLDAFAGVTELTAQVAEAWRQWSEARQRHQLAVERGDHLAVERADLLASLEELEALNFSSEAWLVLQEEQRRLAHAAELLQGAQAVADALEADEQGVLAQLRVIRNRLASLVEIDAGLGRLLADLEGASQVMQDSVRDLHRYAEGVDLDPEALMQVETRLAGIQATARKYQIRPEAIPDLWLGMKSRLQALGNAVDLAALEQAELEREAFYRERASTLGERRRQAAEKLGRQVTQSMQELAMRGGRFAVALATCSPAAQGLEEVSFLVSPHAGQALQDLARTASGGELSRLGLALQTVLSRVSGAATLVFDEVDAGIGGGVAEIVGRLLAQQGENRQVLCVTHLPQVAARAHQHYRVSKSQLDGQVRTAVELLDGAARREELARMLGGMEITEATRRHAAEMLVGDGATKTGKTRRR